jgi:hypothetical protein
MRRWSDSRLRLRGTSDDLAQGTGFQRLTKEWQ